MADSERFVISSGPGAVAVGGGVRDSIFVTGDNGIVSLNYGEEFSYQILDDEFRKKQANNPPADFYNGTRANWANICHADDVRRIRYEQIRSFVEDADLPPQRMGLISGLAGEGKSTLLMRLAWDLAENGYPVFWRHSGQVLRTSALHFETSLPVILCFDQVGDETKLPDLVRDLTQFGMRFIILASERKNEWRNAGLEAGLQLSIPLEIFELSKLERSEVEGLLDRLEQAHKLDALEKLSREKQVHHFLDQLKADGQLLPALLAARSGKSNFEAIILDVLEYLRKRPDGDFLIQAFILIASVHRFGFWLTRSLFARSMHIPERKIGLRVLNPLLGELLEVSLIDERRLYTRHPFIAEKVMQLAEQYRYAPEGKYVYQRLFQGIRDMAKDKSSLFQYQLLTILPLAFKKRGEIDQARNLFQEATRSNPSHAPTWQAWALLEKEQGNYSEARRLFQEATLVDPKNAPSWQAWALLEKEQGNYSEARRLFQEATRADPNHGPSWQAWALLEKEQGGYDEARRLFKMATEADPHHAPSWQAWALLEKEQGNYFEARSLFKKATVADPKHAPAWQAWALMEKEQGGYDEARRLFKEATDADPKGAPAWQAWAVMEKEQGNFSEARRLFQEATRANIDHAPSWQAWALMEKELGNYPEARRLFQEATQADPKHAPAWQPWALLEKELGDYDEARRLFEKATQADPKHAPAWQPWALMEKDLGNYAEARYLFQKATEADPKHAPAWQAWALMELELGNFDQALSYAQRAVELDSQGFYPYIARGRIFAATGQTSAAHLDFELAKKRLQTRLKRQTKNTKLANLYADVLIELHEYALADRVLSEALEVCPIHQKQYVHTMLGRLYLAQGEREKAITEFERALDYAPNNLEAKNLLDHLNS